MADQKLTALSAWPAPALTDLTYVVIDPAGTPASHKGTWTQVQALMQGGLTTVLSSADANLALAVNTMHVVDISGFSADRTATLPAVSAVGDRVGLMLSVGDTAFEMLITATSGDTLNGIAGGTEWSRLFISYEVVIMRCTVANTTWVVECDGRIPWQCLMELTTLCDGEAANTFTTPTAAPTPGAFTAIIDIGNVTTVASSLFTARRAAKVLTTIGYLNKDAGTTGNYINVRWFKNGTTDAGTAQANIDATVGTGRPILAKLLDLALNDTITFQYRTQAGGLGAVAASSNFLSATEIL